MFKKHSSGRKAANPIFLLFRLILSLSMFTLLVLGGYEAYKHFSGLDPLKLDPQALVKNVLGAKNPDQVLAALSALKINNPLKTDKTEEGNKQVEVKGSNKPLENVSFRFLVVSDTHNDNENLRKAILQAKADYPDLAFIIGLGDYTDTGTSTELKKAKNVLDSSGLRYFLVAGDHDLWEARDKGLPAITNYSQVFGPVYQSFIYNNLKFLLLDNSDNYIGITNDQQTWITSELEAAKKENKGILVFIHEPLYHPSSDHYMGKVEKDLKPQAESLIYQLKQASVKKIFSGDIHYFSEYEEPVTKLSMVTVGALVTQRNPQIPRFAIVSVSEDGNTSVEDVELK